MKSDNARLYKRVGAGEPARSRVLHVGAASTFAAGQYGYLPKHQCGAPVVLTGIYGPFRLRISGADWLNCRAALVPAGVVHELDCIGQPVSCVWVEPGVADRLMLEQLVGEPRNVGNATIGCGTEITVHRELYENGYGGATIEAALADLIDFCKRRRRPPPMDPRIVRVIASMPELPDEVEPVERLARTVGLSGWRLQHLFTAAVGVPLRRYRVWSRTRAAMVELLNGSSLTVAACAAGFFDLAHFSHVYRRTFGAKASRLLIRDGSVANRKVANGQTSPLTLRK